jgi:signal transduction histidine kinase
VIRTLRFGLLPAAIFLGIFAEWAALRRGPFEPAASSSDVRLAVADFVVGVVLVSCGVVAWDRRPESLIGVLLAATGLSWFLGTFSASGWPGFAAFGSLFVTLHRGPLTHAMLAYPSGQVGGWIERSTIAGLYILSAVAVAADTVAGTVVTAALVLAVATFRYTGSTGPERRARFVGAVVAATFSAVLFISASARLAGGGVTVQRAVLWAYEIVVVLIALALLLDLLLRRWTRATVTSLVVDLGSLDETAPLRDRLAAALGDPSLEIGYWLTERDAYVDDSGRVLELPDARSSRVVTIVREHDEVLAALVHDSAALRDAELLDSVAAAARIAVANARLQAEVRSQVEEIESSRRRIVEAGDTQRRRLERQLREGAERRLVEVAALLDEPADEGGPGFAAMLVETRAELDRAQVELREFARGIHPRVLTEDGLAAAIADLPGRAGVSVELRVTEARFPSAVEAAAYFVCSEALANIGKYAEASRAVIEVTRRGDLLVVSVDDDGRGGASLDEGSGLRGLADRVEALGGSLTVTSRPGEGTHLRAQLPLNRDAAADEERRRPAP